MSRGSQAAALIAPGTVLHNLDLYRTEASAYGIYLVERTTSIRRARTHEGNGMVLGVKMIDSPLLLHKSLCTERSSSPRMFPGTTVGVKFGTTLRGTGMLVSRCLEWKFQIFVRYIHSVSLTEFPPDIIFFPSSVS